ncbi:hypothetical protein [Radiobacillus sp. PE A8.2]
MFIFIGFIVIFITLVSIESQLRKSNQHNEEVIKLLKEIKEKK